MPRLLCFLTNGLIVLALLAGCGGSPTQAPATSPSPSPVLPTPTQTRAPQATAVPQPTTTPTATAAPSATPLPPLPAGLATRLIEPDQPVHQAGGSALRELARWGKSRA